MSPFKQIFSTPAILEQDIVESTIPNTTQLFTEICNRMETDIEWLTAEPRAESELLLRYFSDQVSRLKDLFEYREMLYDCLDAVAGEGREICVYSA